MGTLIWLAFTTLIGWAIGNYVPAEAQPVFGAFVGFIVGLILRMIIAIGGVDGGDDVFDAAGDVFDAFDGD